MAIGGRAADNLPVETPTDLPLPTIDRKPFDGEMHDVMGGSGRWEIKVHDHGLVALLDVMPRLAPVGKTADFAIVQAARVSYGAGTKLVNEDRGLIRYLVRHRHSTPLEMVEFKFHHVMPIFVARQWIRHRTACLAGDSRLSFDLPGAARRGEKRRRQHVGMSIERLHRLWHDGGERDRVARMSMRMCDEQTGEIRHTRVTDVWETGVRPVFRVTLANGYALTMTRDHRCLTDRGWMTLGEATGLRTTAVDGVTWDADAAPALAVNGEPAHRSAAWLRDRTADGWDVMRMADAAGVSYHAIRQNLRRCGPSSTPAERSTLSGRARQGQGRTFRRRPLADRARANARVARSGPRSNFWKGGVTTDRANIGRWTTDHAHRTHQRDDFECVLCGSNQELAAHHVDPVWHNPSRGRDESNLTTLCGTCHSRVHRANLELALMAHVDAGRAAADFWTDHPGARPRPPAKRLPTPRLLVRGWSRVVRIDPAGERMTYDLSVAGPFHNFVANGFVVHNSVNEYSARYSVVRDRFYRPSMDNVRQQSNTNRQGGDEPIDPLTAQQFLDYLDRAEGQYAEYERLMAAGVSRELARIALPVSTYTEWYWKCDLHNVLRFLSLRMDAHAQQEIRDYATAMYALIRPIVPLACEAFADYEVGGLHLTRLEVESLKSGQPLASDNKREQAEWAAKRGQLGL